MIFFVNEAGFENLLEVTGFTYVSKMVPLSLNNKYTVEITDIQGLSSVFVCPLAVTKKLEDKGLSSSDISNLVGNVTDPQEKINVNLD